MFENAALDEWAPWTDNGRSTEVVTNDAEHDQVTGFTLPSQVLPPQRAAMCLLLGH